MNRRNSDRIIAMSLAGMMFMFRYVLLLSGVDCSVIVCRSAAASRHHGKPMRRRCSSNGSSSVSVVVVIVVVIIVQLSRDVCSFVRALLCEHCCRPCCICRFVVVVCCLFIIMMHYCLFVFEGGIHVM